MDFFTNLTTQIKSTLNKRDNETGSEIVTSEKNDGGKAEATTDGDLKPPQEKPRRSSSGDTSGPDDNVNDAIEVGEDEVVIKEDNDAAVNPTSSEAVYQKGIEGAKYFGNLFYSFANKAGQTMTATAKQFKQTVESTSILADFTKEQQDFVKEHGGNLQVGELPWSGCEDEENVKQQILSLSQDKRNFVRSPPSGVQFQFDVESAYPVALAILKEDANLNKMRFEIVPKLVNEETFWRNYFYRISLIKQSTHLSNLGTTKDDGQKSWSSSRSSSAEGPDDPNDNSPTNVDAEFISDAFQGNDQISEEDLRKGMRQLGVGGKQDSVKDDSHWEEEVQRDLQEFEVVGGDVQIDEDELEKDLAELENT